MDDLTDVDAQGTEAPELEPQSTSVTETEPVEPADSDESKGNPAWESVRSKLDPMLFASIESDLKGFDKNAQSRIESLNKQYSPYKEFADQGVEPQQISQAMMLARQIDENPAEIYQKLGEFLKQTGRLPETQAEVEEALGEDDDEEGVDPRFAKLEAQQEQINSFLQAQAAQEVAAQADKALDNEISSLRKAHPEMSDEDLNEVINRAATLGFMNQQKGLNKVPKLEDVFNSVAQYKSSILQTQRAGDSAPRLIPTSGGVPSSATGEKKSLGQLTSDESANLLAGMMSAGEG